MGNQASDASGDSVPARTPSRTGGGSALAEKFGKTTNWERTCTLKV